MAKKQEITETQGVWKRCAYRGAETRLLAHHVKIGSKVYPRVCDGVQRAKRGKVPALCP